MKWEQIKKGGYPANLCLSTTSRNQPRLPDHLGVPLDLVIVSSYRSQKDTEPLSHYSNEESYHKPFFSDQERPIEIIDEEYSKPSFAHALMNSSFEKMKPLEDEKFQILVQEIQPPSHAQIQVQKRDKKQHKKQTKKKQSKTAKTAKISKKSTKKRTQKIKTPKS